MTKIIWNLIIIIIGYLFPSVFPPQSNFSVRRFDMAATLDFNLSTYAKCIEEQYKIIRIIKLTSQINNKMEIKGSKQHVNIK